MPEVFVSIGSNIDRERSISAGIDALWERFGILRLSSVYETDAVGFSGEPFYNLVAAFRTDEAPEAINAWFKQVEAAQGRDPEDPKFSPRTLDIDLLLYGDQVIDQPGMQLPRDEIDRYAFVLEPLAEIEPDMRYPGRDTTFLEMWRDAVASGEMKPAHKVTWQPGGESG
jgi:2-amino-4-hydroxy-6-hydroxymethyldihydropteridine diphosphokinase